MLQSLLVRGFIRKRSMRSLPFWPHNPEWPMRPFRWESGMRLLTELCDDQKASYLGKRICEHIKVLMQYVGLLPKEKLIAPIMRRLNTLARKGLNAETEDGREFTKELCFWVCLSRGKLPFDFDKNLVNKLYIPLAACNVMSRRVDTQRALRKRKQEEENAAAAEGAAAAAEAMAVAAKAAKRARQEPQVGHNGPL